MSNQLKSFFTSFDVFGEPVSVNYKGESSFRTSPGALFTIMIKAFLLVFVVQGTLSLFNYEDPQVFQYTIYESRRDGKKVNLGESRGNFAFVWFNRATSTADEPDPRYVTFSIMLATNDLEF